MAIFPGRHWFLRIAPEPAPLLSGLRLGLPVARLEIGSSFGQILGIDPTQALPQQLQAGVDTVNVDNSDRAAVSVDRVRIEGDLFAVDQLAHGLLGAVTESLAELRGIEKSNTNFDLRFA